ncbi:MAG: hypothetical protein FWD24_05580 [Treponema sp.]|nr:hypothetical protein [Treponema sp.]
MNGMIFLLFIYAAFTVNIVLQCALGIKGVVESKSPINIVTYIKAGIIFFTIILLWFFFSKVLLSIASGLFIYILLFPVSAIIYDALEYIIFNFLVKKDAKSDSIINFPGGITAVAVFICINITGSIFFTIVLSLGFVSGIFLINLIIREIRRRAALEAVPVFLRGKPLVLVSMGLISLVFTTASLLLFRMIGNG